jgi:hypothetical protein
MTRLFAVCLVSLVGFAVVPAQAQMGTSRNPPPQNLFHFDGHGGSTPATGSTMAQRRQQLAASKRAPVRRPVTKPRVTTTQ